MKNYLRGLALWMGLLVVSAGWAQAADNDRPWRFWIGSTSGSSTVSTQSGNGTNPTCYGNSTVGKACPYSPDSGSGAEMGIGYMFTPNLGLDYLSTSLNSTGTDATNTQVTMHTSVIEFGVRLALPVGEATQVFLRGGLIDIYNVEYTNNVYDANGINQHQKSVFSGSGNGGLGVGMEHQFTPLLGIQLSYSRYAGKLKTATINGTTGSIESLPFSANIATVALSLRW